MGKNFLKIKKFRGNILSDDLFHVAMILWHFSVSFKTEITAELFCDINKYLGIFENQKMF